MLDCLFSSSVGEYHVPHALHVMIAADSCLFKDVESIVLSVM